MRILSSSKEFTLQGTWYEVEAELPVPGVTIRLGALCSIYEDILAKYVTELNSFKKYYISYIKIDIVQKYGLEAVLIAHLAAYTAYRRGLQISRIKGLDTLLLVTGKRNIRSILQSHVPQEGEKVVVIYAAESSTPPPPPTRHATCTIRSSTPLEITEAALSPIDLRIYKVHYM